MNKSNVLKNASAVQQPAEREKAAVEQPTTQPAEVTEDKQAISAPVAARPPGSLSVGSEAKEITIEGLLQGLKLKKDLHFGKISRPGWKDHKPIVTKVN